LGTEKTRKVPKTCVVPHHLSDHDSNGIIATLIVNKRTGEEKQMNRQVDATVMRRPAELG